MAAHPNELDARRIMKRLAQRQRYRYVTPRVVFIENGYQIVSPCCSRNVDARGGEIDIARLEYDADQLTWLLFRKNHRTLQWELSIRSEHLEGVLSVLNDDTKREFWQ